MKKIYLQPKVKDIKIDVESLLDVISNGKDLPADAKQSTFDDDFEQDKFENE